MSFYTSYVYLKFYSLLLFFTIYKTSVITIAYIIILDCNWKIKDTQYYMKKIQNKIAIDAFSCLHQF